jgi:hypothetical protein
MRKLATGLLIAASALALAGCEKKAESTAEPMAEATESAAAMASEGTDADAAATDEGDPNGNPVKP